MTSQHPCDTQSWLDVVEKLRSVKVRVAVWQGRPIIDATLADVVLYPNAFDVTDHFEIVEAAHV